MFSYYDEPSHECFECLEKENRIQDITYWFKAVTDQLYGREEFDAETLERYLDELAGYINTKLPSQKLAVEPSPILENWKVINNHYLKSLASSGA